MSSSKSKKRVRDDDTENNGGNGVDECCDMVDKLLEGKKRVKRGAKDSPSNTSYVHNGPSPSTVNSIKPASKPEADLVLAKRSLSFSDDGTEPGALENGGISQTNSIMKRLKALCSIKEPTVNVGIEMVGAAYLLKHTRSSACDDAIELAMQQAVDAAKLLFDAEQLRNNGLQLLFKSQKSFEKVL